MKNRFTYFEKFNIVTDKKTGEAYKVLEDAIILDKEARAEAIDKRGEEYHIFWSCWKHYDGQDGGTYADWEHPARIEHKGDAI